VKYVVVISALVFFGCSQKPSVTIVGANGSQSDWTLVSVRDTSIVVLPTFEETGKGIAFTHCIVINAHEINHVIVHPNVGFFSQIPVALFGSGVGIALKACNCEDRLYHSVIGFIAGYNYISLLTFFLMHLKEDSYFLWLESDRERLRKNAVFPIEPDIMQYIK
jgi:hypothetical protein